MLCSFDEKCDRQKKFVSRGWKRVKSSLRLSSRDYARDKGSVASGNGGRGQGVRTAGRGHTVISFTYVLSFRF